MKASEILNRYAEVYSNEYDYVKSITISMASGVALMKKHLASSIQEAIEAEARSRTLKALNN